MTADDSAGTRRVRTGVSGLQHGVVSFTSIVEKCRPTDHQALSLQQLACRTVCFLGAQRHTVPQHQGGVGVGGGEGG